MVKSVKQLQKEIRELRKRSQREGQGQKAIRDIKRKRGISGRLAGGFRFLQRGVGRSLYERSLPPVKKSKGRVKQGRGRPRGTVKYTDPKTGQPIGVYEFRKLLRARIAKEKAFAKAEARIDPQERRVLQRFNQQRRTQQMSVERRTIPDSYGEFPQLNNIFREIDESANLVR